jgi:CheY-like chemotaxis protein
MKNILLIDNDKASVEIIKGILSSYEVKLEIASDGNNGLELVFSNNYDLVIISADVTNPNGYIVCKRIKQNEHLKATPIIIISDNPQAGEIFKKHSELKVRAEEYIKKINLLDDFSEKIVNLLVLEKIKQDVKKEEIYELDENIIEGELKKQKTINELLLKELTDYKNECSLLKDRVENIKGETLGGVSRDVINAINEKLEEIEQELGIKIESDQVLERINLIDRKYKTLLSEREKSISEFQELYQPKIENYDAINKKLLEIEKEKENLTSKLTELENQNANLTTYEQKVIILNEELAKNKSKHEKDLFVLNKFYKAKIDRLGALEKEIEEIKKNKELSEKKYANNIKVLEEEITNKTKELDKIEKMKEEFVSTIDALNKIVKNSS